MVVQENAMQLHLTEATEHPGSSTKPSNEIHNDVPCGTEMTGDDAQGLTQNTCGEGNAIQKCIRNEVLEADKVVKWSQTATKDIHRVRIIGNSTLDHVNYYGDFAQSPAMAKKIQVFQGADAMRNIRRWQKSANSEPLDDNNIEDPERCGPERFASHAYKFMKAKIEESGSEISHLWFIYHPEANWYPAFARLNHDDPLPKPFCAKSDDLNQLCCFMRIARRALIKENQANKDIVFHLVLPACSPLAIFEPLHFPDGLQPLCIEGATHRGKPYTVLKLPHISDKVLHGVGNADDARDPLNWKTLEEVLGDERAHTTMLLGNVSSLALGASVAAMTGLGALIVVPIWLVGLLSTIPVSRIARQSIGVSVLERPPYFLGASGPRLIVDAHGNPLQKSKYYRLCLPGGRELLWDSPFILAPAGSGNLFYIKDDTWESNTSIMLYCLGTGKFDGWDYFVCRQLEGVEPFLIAGRAEKDGSCPDRGKDSYGTTVDRMNGVYGKNVEGRTLLRTGDGKGMELRAATASDGSILFWMIVAASRPDCWLECSFLVCLSQHPPLPYICLIRD